MSLYSEYGGRERTSLSEVYSIETLESKKKWLETDKKTLEDYEAALNEQIALVRKTAFSDEVVIVPRNYGKVAYFVTHERTPIIDGTFRPTLKVIVHSARYEHTPTEDEVHRRGYSRGRPAAIATAIRWAKDHSCRIRAEMDLTKKEIREILDAGLPFSSSSAAVLPLQVVPA